MLSVFAREVAFESSVISLGNETGVRPLWLFRWFESSVISLGNETVDASQMIDKQFESSVISLGNETTPFTPSRK